MGTAPRHVRLRKFPDGLFAAADVMDGSEDIYFGMPVARRPSAPKCWRCPSESVVKLPTSFPIQACGSSARPSYPAYPTPRSPRSTSAPSLASSKLFRSLPWFGNPNQSLLERQ